MYCVALVSIFQVIFPSVKFFFIFQHMRSHDNEAAWSTEFYDLLTSNVNASSEVKSLRNRCLRPGLYAEHLERWILYFPVSQVSFLLG